VRHDNADARLHARDEWRLRNCEIMQDLHVKDITQRHYGERSGTVQEAIWIALNLCITDTEVGKHKRLLTSISLEQCSILHLVVREEPRVVPA
jgi:hypothetical protein